jgi:hypothetical protein
MPHIPLPTSLMPTKLKPPPPCLAAPAVAPTPMEATPSKQMVAAATPNTVAETSEQTVLAAPTPTPALKDHQPSIQTPSKTGYCWPVLGMETSSIPPTCTSAPICSTGPNSLTTKHEPSHPFVSSIKPLASATLTAYMPMSTPSLHRPSWHHHRLPMMSCWRQSTSVTMDCQPCTTASVTMDHHPCT